MNVGVPKEIKTLEFRVGLTPSSVSELTRRHHKVIIETGAGVGAGYSDEEYIVAGGLIVEKASDVFEQADLIIKIKEPQLSECDLLTPKHTLFTYLHLAASKIITEALVKSGATCIAYETVQKVDGSLPLLQPMSEIAGRLSVIEGAKYLQKGFGGKGILISGTPGVQAAKVIILGGGAVGMQAAKMASGLGADVTIFDTNLQRIRYLDENMPKNVRVLFSTQTSVSNALKSADIVIGAVLIPGKEAPKLISRKDLQDMEMGTVLVDVAIDQGGCFETSKATTHHDPYYIVDGILHYCVANMPGCVPRTSTEALNNATLPYVLQLADKGVDKAVSENQELLKGVNIKSKILVLNL